MSQRPKQKLELIRSLKLGDVVIAGSHIGAIRYLGPLEGPQSTAKPTKPHRVHDLFVALELTEPRGHMDGSMVINGQTVRYFHPTKSMESKETESDWTSYGVLLPAVSIQRKVDPFSMLMKTTMIFEEYKSMRKQLDFARHRMADSDLISAAEQSPNRVHLHRQYHGRTPPRKVKQ